MAWRFPGMGSGTFIPIRTVVFYALCLILALEASDAHTFGGVPMPWLAMFLATPLIVVYGLFSRLTAMPGVSIYLLLLAWLLVNTGITTLQSDYSTMMPPLATTSYPTFMFLRAYSFFGFLFLTIVIYNYARTEPPDALLNFIALLGVLVTAYAAYVLVAQRLSLPIIPKTRFGTGENGAIAGGDTGYFGDAGEQYLFRSIGSFREPSFLGIWLIMPFFLSIAAAGGRLLNWRTIVIGLGVLSTGSLTAAVAGVAGLVAALLLAQPFSKRGLQIVVAAVLMVGVLGLSINWFAQVYLEVPEGVSFSDQYSGRLEKLATGGIGNTNRGYAFKYFEESEFSLAGLGMGNAHIERSIGAVFIISFLSLYFNVWFAGGAIALALLIAYLLVPPIAVLIRWRANVFGDVWFVAPYVAWTVIFLVNDEQLNVSFAFATGMLWARLYPLRAQPAPAAPPPLAPAQEGASSRP